MKRCVVTFQPGDIHVEVEKGTTLLQAQVKAGLRPNAPCGGRGVCGKCRVSLDGNTVLACRTAVVEDSNVTIAHVNHEEILASGTAGNVQADGENAFALAFDIGTTTIVGYLLDGRSGEQLASASCINPQTQYGADVISRIQYALGEGAEALRVCVRSALAQLTADAVREAGIALEQIGCAAIAGNTAMHHLFLGIDPHSLITPPYMPAVSKALEIPAGDLLPIEGEIRVLPNIAGFVGGDTVGGMISSCFGQMEKLTLLIDIGTNGEMVLGDGNRRIACSAAAGPAFEGAQISCGMRGVEGAVDHVTIEHGTAAYHVIGGGDAVGLCGSGLLDLIVVLLKLGVIDESGCLDGGAYRLGGTSVVLTQRDVREVQLAKAAIRTGIELSARRMGVNVTDIQQVLLAGAFGNYLTPASACQIGMIPACLGKCIQPVGNAAGEGAKICAVNRGAFLSGQELAEKTDFLELASMPEFQDIFVDFMDFAEEGCNDL